MNCAGAPQTFRLLDGLVGWDAASLEDIAGHQDASGIHLARRAPEAGVPPGVVWPYMSPPRLAYDCSSCTWLLVTPSPPSPRLLQLGPCDPCGGRWASTPFSTEGLDEIDAVAVHSNLVAAAARERGEVRIWTRDGALVGVAQLPEPTHLAFRSACELLAVSRRRRIVRLDPAGVPFGVLDMSLPTGDLIEASAASSDGSVWVLVREADGRGVLRRRACDGGWRDASLAELREALADTGLTLVAPDGFCLRRPPGDRNAETCCFTWYGRAAAVSRPPEPANVFALRGQLLTDPIDSGLPRCRWHRVRIDADVPVGTGIEIAVATSEIVEGVAPQGQADPAWPGFEAGTPHPLDWQTMTGTDDFLVDQPPGRYLYVRLRLTSDGMETPVLRSVRLDFPRATSTEALPAVYREEPRAEDFTESFIALFDAALEDIDRAVERFPALFDVEDTPEDVLPWLGRFLGAAFDPAWEAARRRKILASLPELFERRGTPAGIAQAVRLVFDLDPVIEEGSETSAFAAVAERGCPSPLDARLGGVRLFGRARSRFRLGASLLGRTPLRSHGDPSLDPLSAGAFRFSLLLPASGMARASTIARLRRLVDTQRPAHTIARVRVGSDSPLLGTELRVGIDTRLGAPPPPVLGARGNVRLRRAAILRGRPRAGAVVGHSTVIPSTC